MLASTEGGVIKPERIGGAQRRRRGAVDPRHTVGQHDEVLLAVFGERLEHRADHQIRRQANGIRLAGKRAIAGSCQGPALGSALNRPSEIGVALAVTGIPTAEVTARSARSMACRPLLGDQPGVVLVATPARPGRRASGRPRRRSAAAARSPTSRRRGRRSRAWSRCRTTSTSSWRRRRAWHTGRRGCRSAAPSASGSARRTSPRPECPRYPAPAGPRSGCTPAAADRCRGSRRRADWWCGRREVCRCPAFRAA